MDKPVVETVKEVHCPSRATWFLFGFIFGICSVTVLVWYILNYIGPIE